MTNQHSLHIEVLWGRSENDKKYMLQELICPFVYVGHYLYDWTHTFEGEKIVELFD